MKMRTTMKTGTAAPVTELQGSSPVMEKERNDFGTPHVRHNDPTMPNIFGAGSLGVRRVEAMAAQMTTMDKIFLVISIFIVAYAYTLSNVLNYAYQPYGIAQLNAAALTSTVTIARGVIAAALQPVIAKATDVFGRMELIYMSIFFYIIGMACSAAAQNVATLLAGQVLFQIGFTTIQLVVEVLIADLTSLRSRLLVSYVPSAPYIINVWISGNISAAVLAVDGPGWRWGFGMWCIIFPFSCLPLLITMGLLTRRARKSGLLEQFKSPLQHMGVVALARELFWQLDIIGMILLILVFGLILVPLTLAGGVSSNWSSASIIAPLVIGFVLVPVFAFWERMAKYPLVPFHLLKDRGVWGPLGIALFLNFAWYMQGDYLYSVLIVAFDFSYINANRISSLYTFVSVLMGLAVGIAVRFVKQLKWFIVSGTVLFMVAFGVLIRYRGGTDGASQSGVIGGEVLLGIAGGLFPYAAQASIQSCVRHENLATVTGLFLATYSIGSALGAVVSGAYWTNTIYARLVNDLASTGNATALATYAYANPFLYIVDYPVGTPQRTGVINAYQETQKVLCIIGLCLCIPLICFGLVSRNKKLGAEQSLKNAERYAPDSSSESDVERKY